MMRATLQRALTGAVLGALLVLVGGIAALGATPILTLYLTGDYEPIGSMSMASPPSATLVNYDPDRDFEPGLVLARSGSGAGETDPTKYQQWELDANSETLSISNLQIWAAMKEFDRTGSGLLGVYLLDCGTSCTVLESRTKAVKGTADWARITVPFSTEHRFEPGHALAVKVVVLSDSNDIWFAYGTDTYSAHILARSIPEATTTSTTVGTPVSTTPTTVPVIDPTTSTSTTSSTAVAGGVAGIPPPPTPPGAGENEAGDVSITPGADLTPSLPMQPQLISDSASTETLATELPVAATLSPQEGLRVAFATVAQTFQAQLLAALALGLFGSMLILAMQPREDEGPRESALPEPGSWWFSG